MATLKIGYGYYSGILSVSADVYESLLDSIANIVVFIAVSLSSRPEDKNHPQWLHQHNIDLYFGHYPKKENKNETDDKTSKTSK